MTTPNTESDNRRALNTAVANEVATNGWRVESQTNEQAILAKGKPVNHVLHGVLTLLSAGVWLIVWLPLWLVNRRQTLVLSVDDYGNVRRIAN